MEQAHEQPPASPTPGSQPVKEAKEVKEATETECVKRLFIIEGVVGV